MIVARTIPALRIAVAALPRPVALAPTMGALHAGHLALLAAGRARGASLVASVFVNPLQFASPGDAAAYPRDEAADLAMLEGAGCAVAWVPDAGTMYPQGGGSRIETGGPSIGLEGEARPGHFTGVTTVVGKLFHQVGPDLALFGEKDWQQLQVIRQMIEDLDWPIELVPVATVRESDGLAMSSRNRLLAPAERAVAPALHRMLLNAAGILRGRGTHAMATAAAALLSVGMTPDYISLVDARTMELLDEPTRPARLVAAVRVGAVRLLDNVAIPAWEQPSLP